MKYWKTGNDVYIGDAFGDAIELTEAEFNSEMLIRREIDVRDKRDSLINDTIWRVQRYESETRLGITTTDNIANIDEYIQALRDIPQQEGFPNNITWPSKP